MFLWSHTSLSVERDEEVGIKIEARERAGDMI
jgi:hypothetical protein